MLSLAEIAGWTSVALAFCGTCFSLASVRALGRAANPKEQGTASLPPVTLLKPLNSSEPGLEENLRSFCIQDYPSPVQIVFGIRNENDSAIPIVEALKRDYSHLDIMLVSGPPHEAENPKIANLLPMIPCAKHEILVLSDSDIRVPTDYLKRVTVALDRPGVGAVTCYYVGGPSDQFWSRMAAMGINYHFLPNVALGVAMGRAKPCFGSTIAMRRTVLEAIGGFQAFAAELADDYAIGREIRARGYRVAIPPFAVVHGCVETQARELFLHELRWARTIRSIDPAGHGGSAITHVVPLGILAVMFSGASLSSVFVLAAALGARFLVKWQVDRAFGSRGTSFWLLPLRDVLSFAVFIGSFFGKRVEWRGLRYQVNAAGALKRE